MLHRETIGVPPMHDELCVPHARVPISDVELLLFHKTYRVDTRKSDKPLNLYKPSNPLISQQQLHRNMRPAHADITWAAIETTGLLWPHQRRSVLKQAGPGVAVCCFAVAHKKLLARKL